MGFRSSKFSTAVFLTTFKERHTVETHEKSFHQISNSEGLLWVWVWGEEMIHRLQASPSLQLPN